MRVRASDLNRQRKIKYGMVILAGCKFVQYKEANWSLSHTIDPGWYYQCPAKPEPFWHGPCRTRHECVDHCLWALDVPLNTGRSAAPPDGAKTLPSR
jgi:hypothetical protein